MLAALSFILVLLLAACGSGENRAVTMHLIKTEGMVRVDDAKGDSVKVTENLGLYSGYDVSTREESYGWLNLDDTKLAKMDEESEIQVWKNGRMLELYVRFGGLFFNVTEPLAEDESMDIRTSTMAVGIRGTSGWVEVENENLMCVYLLRGKVECTVFSEDDRILASETITAGQAARMVLDGGEASVMVAEYDRERLPAFVEDALENPENWGVPGIDRIDGSDGTGSGVGENMSEGSVSQDVSEAGNGGEASDAETTASENLTASGNANFVSWADAGLTDHVMDWRDEALEARMATLTGIADREIMLSDVWEMTELHIAGRNNISDISALGELTNLTTLTVAQGGVTDISVLAGLTNLTVLDLSHNEITDISALAGLTNLTELNLRQNNISDIGALAGLTDLTFLHLGENNISDISVLGNLANNLTNLYLQDNSISDIGTLAGLKNLTNLILTKNRISDISALGGLTNLTWLYLEENNISDVSVLAGLTNLENLRLKGNGISDYSPVEFVPNLYK